MLRHIHLSQECICLSYGRNPPKSELFYEPILQRPKEPINPALSLGTTGSNELNGKFGNNLFILGNPFLLITSLVYMVNAPPVSVQADRPTFFGEVVLGYR